MEDLKKEYNRLLQSYNRGIEKMASEPDKEKEILKGLEELQLKMNEILGEIPNHTEEETVNGFDLSKKVEPIEVTGEIVETQEQEVKPQIVNRGTNQPEIINTFDNYKDNWQMSVQLSKSDLIPDNYKNKPENVMIALGISQQTSLPPFTIMQNLNIVRGRASFSGSFCRTLIEKTGKYKNLDLIYVGEEGKDSYGAYLQAIRKSDNKIVKGPTVTIQLAKQEGWYSKKDKYGKETSKWTTMPELMLGYRATAFFARLYEPSALNGVYTSEEVEDIENQKKEVNDVL